MRRFWRFPFLQTHKRHLGTNTDANDQHKIELLRNFQSRNKLQEVAKELNILALNKNVNKQAKKMMSTAFTDKSKTSVKETMDTDFARYTISTWKLLREFVLHPNYHIIGHIKTNRVDKDGMEELSYNFDRFEFDNVDQSLGLMLFAFSDEKSKDNFQSQSKKRQFNFSNVSANRLVPVLSNISKKHQPNSYTDKTEQKTGGIIVDPSLPSYFFIQCAKFHELDQLSVQLRIEKILRKIQWELNQCNLSEYSQKFLVTQFTEYDKFYAFTMTDANKKECLITVAQNLNENEEQFFAPVFTDIEEARNYVLVLQDHFLDGTSKINVNTYAASELLSWLEENDDVSAFVFNPMDDLSNLPELELPTKSCEFAENSSIYYGLPDAPDSPYLCILPRDLFFEEHPESV